MFRREFIKAVGAAVAAAAAAPTVALQAFAPPPPLALASVRVIIPLATIDASISWLRLLYDQSVRYAPPDLDEV